MTEVLSPDRRLSDLRNRYEAPALPLDEALLPEDVAKGLSELVASIAGRMPLERARGAERRLEGRITALRSTERA